MARPGFPRRRCLIAAAVGMAAAGIGLTAVTPGPRFYPVQLHLHGSMSEGNASMRAHNTVARELGTVDVLWWTDHDWRIAGHGHVPGLDFDGERQVFQVPDRDGYRSRHSRASVEWTKEADAGVEDAWARLTGERAARGSHALEIGARARGGASEWQWAGVEVFNTGGRLKAPLAADVVVELLVHPLSPWSEDSRLMIRYELSYQADSAAELVYVLDDRGPPRLAASPRRRTAYVPIEATLGEWSRLEMNVTRDALAFDLGGWDNSLREIRIGTQVRRGARSAMVVDDLRVWRHRTGPEVLERAEEIAAALEKETGLVNLVGIEISYADHMNAYLPEVELPDFERYPHGMRPEEIVPWVHERGGVVSYNHVFGALESQAVEYKYRSRRLVENRAFGADLLEVGYPHRVFPLERHLAVWDHLSRDRVVIGGIGTSDSHNYNSGWKDGNNYVTWVWARSAGRLDLIEGLRSRRAFFGDPVLFRGELRLETDDGIPMGQVVRTDTDYRDVVLSITELPAGTELRWIEQGKVTRVVAPPAGDYSERFRVETGRYRFVRVEVWKGERGLAFSNCLYFVPADSETPPAP